MIDLGKTIEPKSDQLNSDDLIPGPITVTIRKVAANSDADQPVSIFYEGDNNKPYKACKSMRRVLVNAWGRDGTQYVGKSMTLFREPTVKFGGLEVGGIRISHMSHIDKPLTMALTATRGSRKPYTVKPLVVEIPTAGLDKEEILESAREAAGQGKDAFNAHWKSLSIGERAVVKDIMDECKTLAVAADQPPVSSDPTPSDDSDEGNTQDVF